MHGFKLVNIAALKNLHQKSHLSRLEKFLEIALMFIKLKAEIEE